MIRIALVGYGYWGPRLARHLSSPGRSRLAAICDLAPGRLAVAAEDHPDVLLTVDAAEIGRSSSIDAVVVATPAASHFDIALQALAGGKHTLVCKPLADSADRASRLVDEADRRRRVLLVDHTAVYSGAIDAMREVVRSGRLGQVHYWDATRVNLGLFRPDVSVLWDLAIHDLAAIDHVLGQRPDAVSATGAGHLQGWPASAAYVTLFLPAGAVAHINVNWLAPLKVRRTVVGGSEAMLVQDELQSSPPLQLRLYDRGVSSLAEEEVSYRDGEVTALPFDGREPLAREVEHFLDCIEGVTSPMTSGEAALRLVRVLEHAEASLRALGRPVELS